MPKSILATKLYIPPLRPEIVPRPRLTERLNEGLSGKLTLISASAGFGKTTLLGEWTAVCGRPVAWLSLDRGDSDPARFLSCLIASLQTVIPEIGKGFSDLLQSPQPPPFETVMTTLLNEISEYPSTLILVLDDYHLIDHRQIDEMLEFLLEHIPRQIHLVIASREDPGLPLSRLRARGNLTELRTADLRFTSSEAADFLNRMMGLDLSPENISALENRTEGWIAGLQLAAHALQGGSFSEGHHDASSFITSFSGSHRFVMDYLVEEVLHQQPKDIQTFLLRTSILERLCGPLCDAVLLADVKSDPVPPPSGQETLEHLEQANLFILPLDNNRRWYRYHHLFADLLRQRLYRSIGPSAKLDRGTDIEGENEDFTAAELHRRASRWYEDNHLEIDALHHAAAAGDVERAVRIAEGKGMPLHFRGAVAPVLHWLMSLPKKVLDEKPSLWVMYASALSMDGQLPGVEEKLQAAEAALQITEPDENTPNLIGHIAAIRALLAAAQNRADVIIDQSLRALAYLHPDNLPVRTATIWKLGWAYQLQGNRSDALNAYTKAITISRQTGNTIINLSATIGLGTLLEKENKLHQAADTFQEVLRQAGEPPQPVVAEAYLGLARIHYQWNDLSVAERHAQKAAQLGPKLVHTDRFVTYGIFLARLKLAQGDAAGAAELLDEAEKSAHQNIFDYRLVELAAVRVRLLLHLGYIEKAYHVAHGWDVPLSRARVFLARGETEQALSIVEAVRREGEEKELSDEVLRAIVLQSVVLEVQGKREEALNVLEDAFALAEPGGFIRIFVDEGPPMVKILSEATERGIMPDYTGKLLAACEGRPEKTAKTAPPRSEQSIRPLIEPLSRRELEVLRLIAEGLSNHEISERLFIALSTVKGHNLKIFEKLQVQRRTEAVARARELGLLQAKL